MSARQSPEGEVAVKSASGDQVWFAVQSFFIIEAGLILAERGQMYEERITLWRARTRQEAVDRAADEAEKYAQDNGYERVDYSVVYSLIDLPGDGCEVWSFMRDSWLDPSEYIGRFVTDGDPTAVPFVDGGSQTEPL